jgi:outer membrane protein TolC
MKYLTATVAFFLAAQLLAQQSLSVSVAEAQDYAVTHAYTVQTNSLEVEKARKLYLENIGRGLPQVSANGNYTYNLERQSFIADLGSGQLGLLQIGAPYSALGTVAAEQLIFDGSYIVALLASQVLKENALNDLEKSRIEIRDQVARAYHLVLVSRRTAEIIAEDLKFLQQSFEETKKLFENGFVEEQDKDQLELLLSNLLNNQDYIQKQEEVALMLLKIRMGLSLETELTLTDDIDGLMVFTEEGTSILSTPFTVENHIDYRSILTQERGQTLNLRNENMQYLPKIKAFYNLNYNVNNMDSWVFTGEQGQDRLDVRWQALGVSLSVPILTGGTRVARVQQAQLALQQVVVAKQQVQDNLKLAYAQAKAEYEYALNTYKTQRRNVEIAKNIRDKTLRKYQEGLATSLELTQAENQYQDSLRNAINTSNQVLDKKVNLEKVLGKYND